MNKQINESNAILISLSTSNKERKYKTSLHMIIHVHFAMPCTTLMTYGKNVSNSFSFSLCMVQILA